MLGRKNYTQAEIDHAKATIEQQLAAHKKLVTVAAAPATDAKLAAALGSFDTLFFNSMALVLDRYFVHRLAGPKYEGKDGNPLNEVRVICDSLITNNGVMRGDNQIKLPRDSSVAKISIGDPIRLTAADFDRLSRAFLIELERRFL